MVIHGAGTAGMGIADMMRDQMIREGLSVEEATRRFWALGRRGLLTDDTPTSCTTSSCPTPARPPRSPAGRSPGSDGIGLADVVAHVRPTMLIGTSTQTGAFTEAIVRGMAEHTDRPIIMPLSNPTSKCEALPADLIRWTDGRALVATGSPFPPVVHDDRAYHIAQANNALVFPGLGLGVTVARASRITDRMIAAAADAVARLSNATSARSATAATSGRPAQCLGRGRCRGRHLPRWRRESPALPSTTPSSRSTKPCGDPSTRISRSSPADRIRPPTRSHDQPHQEVLMSGSVIVGGARTPIGKLAGGLKGFSAMDLGGFAIKAALERSGISGDQVEYVIMGHVIQAGAGQMSSRQAAVKGGIPMTVPALTVNRVCLSGLNAIAMADQLIGYGEFDIVVAGGMESMTNGPYLLPGARAGYRYGNNEIVDATAHDALFCAFDLRGMGDSTDFYSKARNITRSEQDEYSAMSHDRATAAGKNGLFDDEIVTVEVPQRRGDPLLVTEDEGVRPGTTAESLGKLRPAFSADGTVTAGSASQISDGAAAVVVMSRAKAEELGAPILAEIGAHGTVAGPDASLLSQPSNAIAKALGRAGLTPADVDLFEINEAFAAVAIQSMRDLEIGPENVNVNGGAIAMGHPVGASGARLALHLALELGRRGGGLGAAGLCGGGGQGEALLLHVSA